jgi:hypothetical protein
MYENGFNKSDIYKTNTVAFSTQANYTNWSTAACRPILAYCEDKWGATWKKSSGPVLENWD